MTTATTRYALDDHGNRMYSPDGDAVLVFVDGAEFATEWRHVSDVDDPCAKPPVPLRY